MFSIAMTKALSILGGITQHFFLRAYAFCSDPISILQVKDFLPRHFVEI